MEQYWMPKEFDLEHLRYCLERYPAEEIFIRLVGSRGGAVKVKEGLEGRVLDFRFDNSGLAMLIDSAEVFRFSLEDYDKGFSVAYERIWPTENGIGRLVMLSHGEDPYDPNQLEPRRSIMRIVLDSHLMEITFTGRIHLRFHSWWEYPHWKYWTVIGAP
jgi:hypothetical protein